jgi:hypothetical protein
MGRKEDDIPFHWGPVTGLIRARRSKDGRTYHTIIVEGSLHKEWGKSGYFKVRELFALAFVFSRIRFYLWRHFIRF